VAAAPRAGGMAPNAHRRGLVRHHRPDAHRRAQRRGELGPRERPVRPRDAGLGARRRGRSRLRRRSPAAGPSPGRGRGAGDDRRGRGHGLRMGTPVVAGSATTSRPRSPPAWCARATCWSARRCGRHPAHDGRTGGRLAAVPRLPPGTGPVPAQRLHGRLWQLHPLVPGPVGRRRLAGRARPRGRGRGAGAGGVVALPYMLGEKTPLQDPDAGARSSA
jgi:hypothetical protein